MVDLFSLRIGIDELPSPSFGTENAKNGHWGQANHKEPPPYLSPHEDPDPYS
jgi:hypothetical protein